jgi:hypothetical protein
LDYFGSLTAEAQSEFIDASTLSGTLNLVGGQPSDYRRLKDSRAWAEWKSVHWDAPAEDPYRYLSVSDLRGIRADAGIERSRGKSPAIQKDLEEYAKSVPGIKADEIRKHVRTKLGSFLGGEPSNLGGGEWEYAGLISGTRVAVTIDYGGWHQFRYHCSIESRTSDVVIPNFGYEMALGVGLGDWDFLTTDNIDESMKLLVELVEYAGSLPFALASESSENSRV